MEKETMTEYDELIDAEIEKRIAEIEKGDAFPPRFQKKDYIFAISLAVVCLLLVIWGAYL